MKSKPTARESKDTKLEISKNVKYDLKLEDKYYQQFVHEKNKHIRLEMYY